MLKLKTINMETATIDAIFHLPSQTVCIKLRKSISSSCVGREFEIIDTLILIRILTFKKCLTYDLINNTIEFTLQ